MGALTTGHLLALLGVAAALAAAAAFVRGWFLGYPPASAGADLLSAKEQAIVAACADALIPEGGELPLAGTQAGAVAYLDRLLRGLPRRQRVLLRLLLAFVEHAPWVMSLQPRLTRQSPGSRAITLERWRSSRSYFVRASFTSLRTVLTLAYLASPEVAARLGALPDTDPFRAVRAVP